MPEATSPTSLASALGADAATPISISQPSGSPTMPADGSQPPKGISNDPEPRPTQDKLGKTSPPVQEPKKGPGFAKPAIRSAKEMLGLSESPKKTNDAMGRELRKRIKEDSTVIDLKEPDKAKPAEKPAKVEEPSPVAKPTPEAPVEAKVKIGGKEFTQKELEDRMAELEAKAKSPEPITPKKPEADQPQKKPEEIEAERKKARDTYVESRVNNFKPEDHGIKLDQETLDTILSGDKEAIPTLVNLLARTSVASEMQVMERLEKELNPILDAFDKRMAPVLEHHKQIEGYMRTQRIIEGNPDIAPLAAKVPEMEKLIEHNYHQHLTAIQKGVADQSDYDWVQKYESMTSEEREKEVADQIRHARDTWGVQYTGNQASSPSTNPPNPAPAPKPAAPAPKPKPPTGSVGGVGAPSAGGNGGVLGGILASGRM